MSNALAENGQADTKVTQEMLDEAKKMAAAIRERNARLSRREAIELAGFERRPRKASKVSTITSSVIFFTLIQKIKVK